MKPLARPAWSDLIPAHQWRVYRRAIEAVRGTGLPFMLGGGFGLAAYIDRWRNTKDIDFYILPNGREAFAHALANAGFADYYEQLPYDRGWIYRSNREGVIVDLIWSMANRRAAVEESWFQNARSIAVLDQDLQVIPPEELLWCKLYVLQRDHCDWSDVINLLYAAGPALDWDHLLERIQPDFLLLKSVMTLFAWLCPNRVGQFPAKLRREFQMPESAAVSPQEEHRRRTLIDSRAWFAPLLPKDVPLEV